MKSGQTRYRRKSCAEQTGVAAIRLTEMKEVKTPTCPAKRRRDKGRASILSRSSTFGHYLEAVPPPRRTWSMAIAPPPKKINANASVAVARGNSKPGRSGDPSRPLCR